MSFPIIVFWFLIPTLILNLEGELFLELMTDFVNDYLEIILP